MEILYQQIYISTVTDICISDKNLESETQLIAKIVILPGVIDSQVHFETWIREKETLSSGMLAFLVLHQF